MEKKKDPYKLSLALNLPLGFCFAMITSLFIFAGGMQDIAYPSREAEMFGGRGLFYVYYLFFLLAMFIVVMANLYLMKRHKENGRKYSPKKYFIESILYFLAPMIFLLARLHFQC